MDEELVYHDARDFKDEHRAVTKFVDMRGIAPDEVVADVPHGHRGYLVLAEVVHGDRPSQLALALHLGIDRTVMTYLIDDLVEAGLVERRPNPRDRRQRQVVATADGRRLLARLERGVRSAEDAVLGALDDTQRDSFCTLLNEVTRHLGGTRDNEVCEVVAEWNDDAQGAEQPRQPRRARGSRG